MNLKKWLSDGRLETFTTSENELKSIRAAAERNRRDAKIEALSTDNRFGLAYEAALLYAKLVIASAGFRVKSYGAHQTTFDLLQEFIGPEAKLFSDYFDRCRRLRNTLSYDAADVVTETEVVELLAKLNDFERLVTKVLSKNSQ